MPKATVHVRDIGREISIDEITDTLSQEFGDRYKVSIQGGGRDNPDQYIEIAKGWSRAIAVRFDISDNEMELDGTDAMNPINVILSMLIVPILLMHRNSQAAWKEMGEEITAFLESKYGTGIN